MDTNPSAVSALKAHLIAQTATRFIIIKGDEVQGKKAMQHIKDGVQVGSHARSPATVSLSMH